MKEATKIHEILNYVLDKATLKQETTTVKIKINYSDLCNEGFQPGDESDMKEQPSMVDLIIHIRTEFDTSKEPDDMYEQEDEEDEEGHNTNTDSDKKSH